jgi:hypothetical protein
MDYSNTACATVELPSEPCVDRTVEAEKFSSRHFRRGRWVQIRSEAEIRATLDADGTLDGLPFMPEQVKFCGRKFRIYRRADRVFLDHHYYVVRLKSTVLLDDLRCDGTAHGGCQMKCLMFWKEAWLLPAAAPAPEEQTPPAPTTPWCPRAPTEDWSGTGSIEIGGEAEIDGNFTCQATELARIGKRLSGWDLRQYLGDVLNRERSVGEVLQLLGKQARNKLHRLLHHEKNQAQTGKTSKPSGEPLHLQPGEWVEVKSLAEINATLSSDNRLRGLGFSPDQIPFCGKRFRVHSRVERMVLEWTGELKQLRDTVALDDVHCDGSSFRGCPRNCYFLWREDWLKRVDEDS